MDGREGCQCGGGRSCAFGVEDVQWQERLESLLHAQGLSIDTDRQAEQNGS